MEIENSGENILKNQYNYVIILGGGNSIQEGISLGLFDKIKDKNVWSLNYAFMTLNFLPKAQLWVDVSFFRHNIDKLQELYLKGVKCYAKLHDKYAGISEIVTYETTRNPQEIDKKLFIGRMGLTGFFALSLAVKEQYDLIYLLGYDFCSVTNDKQTHYYQDTLNVQSTGFGRPELYSQHNQTKKEVEDFELFLKYPTKILNVSPKSKIEYFEKISYKEMFKRLENEL